MPYRHSAGARSQVVPFPPPGARRPRPVPSDTSVRFEDVRFGYDDAGYTVLKGISFDIPAGRMVALAGHAGAGKRSCARLLLRLWDAEAGCVCIGGMDVRTLSVTALRELVAFVPRDGRLRPASVRELLGEARPGLADAEIVAAARQAEVHEAILRLPEGYDTPYDLWSARLTAAERQRLALACALLSEAPILVLDEIPTSLGAADEQAWRTAVSRIRRGRTVLLISHRLATLRLADSIVVLEQGLVVEEGRHDHLVAWNDRYTRLIAARALHG